MTVQQLRVFLAALPPELEVNILAATELVAARITEIAYNVDEESLILYVEVPADSVE